MDGIAWARGDTPACHCCGLTVPECLASFEEGFMCFNCYASAASNGGPCWHERLRMEQWEVVV